MAELEIEMMRSFSDNPTCRHIVFGETHGENWKEDVQQLPYRWLMRAGQILSLPARA